MFLRICRPPRAFKYNNLGKIWGPNRVNYWELENRDWRNEWSGLYEFSEQGWRCRLILVFLTGNEWKVNGARICFLTTQIVQSIPADFDPHRSVESTDKRFVPEKFFIICRTIVNVDRQLISRVSSFKHILSDHLLQLLFFEDNMFGKANWRMEFLRNFCSCVLWIFFH